MLSQFCREGGVVLDWVSGGLGRGLNDRLHPWLYDKVSAIKLINGWYACYYLE